MIEVVGRPTGTGTFYADSGTLIDLERLKILKST